MSSLAWVATSSRCCGRWTDEAGLLAFAARVLGELRRPVAIEDMTLCVDASIGVVFVTDNGDDLDDLLARADVAMYVAKTTHSGCELYDMHRDQSSVGRTAMAGELRRALEGRELIVHYQPKVELATGRSSGPRHSCAGSIRATGWCSRTSSCRWRSRPA